MSYIVPIIITLLALYLQRRYLTTPTQTVAQNEEVLTGSLLAYLAERESWEWESDPSWNWEGSGRSTRWQGAVYSICYDHNRDSWFPSSKTVGQPQWLEICATMLAMADTRYESIADAAEELENAAEVKRMNREHRAHQRKFDRVREGREDNLATSSERDARRKLSADERAEEAARLRADRASGKVL